MFTDDLATVTTDRQIYSTTKWISRSSVRFSVPSASCCVARWQNGLVTNRSRVLKLASPLSSATLGKLLTHMCLCHQAA